MAVITLTFTGSTEEITSGIPDLMTITSNVPATIFFTLDGAIPTENSPIYISTFQMPDNMNSVTLSAFGIDSDGYSGSILTQVFSPDTTRITITRHIGEEGFVVDRFLDLFDLVDGFDADGTANRFIDKELIDLNPIHSSKGRLGIADGAQIEVGIPSPESTPYPFDDNFTAFSTNEDARFFNPLAKVIVIDNRLKNDIQIVNRPWGSIRTMKREFWGQEEISGADSTYISGGYVKTFYSLKNNTMVAYYFDHNEARHVKSIQELPKNIPNTLGFGTFEFPLVFKWLPWGRHSTIPL